MLLSHQFYYNDSPEGSGCSRSWLAEPSRHIWNRFIPRLSHEGIPFGNFDHTAMNGASVEEIAAALQEYICMKREETGYQGRIDIVCHSMGGGIARYLLEVLDGTTRHEQVGSYRDRATE